MILQLRQDPEDFGFCDQDLGHFVTGQVPSRGAHSTTLGEEAETTI